jgi:hypothetical protein
MVGATVFGFVVAMAVIVAADSVVHAMYPPPPGFDMNNRESVRKLIAGMPVRAFATLLAAWILAGFFGVAAPRWSRNSDHVCCR